MATAHDTGKKAIYSAPNFQEYEDTWGKLYSPRGSAPNTFPGDDIFVTANAWQDSG